jgi:hypothetical protein
MLLHCSFNVHGLKRPPKKKNLKVNKGQTFLRVGWRNKQVHGREAAVGRRTESTENDYAYN